MNCIDFMVVAFFCMWDSYRKSKRLPLYNDPKRTNWDARLCHFFIASAQLIHCLVKCYSVVYFVSVCWESRRVITLQHSTNTAFGLFVSCFIHSIHIAHLSRCYFFLICWVFVLCVCVCYCHHCCRCCFSSSSPSSSSSSSSSLILFSSYFYYFTYEKLSLFETLSHRPYDIFNLEKERWHRRRRNECHTFHFSWRFLATHNRLHSANNARLNGWECTMWPKTIDSIAFRISLPNRWTESTQLGTDFHWFGHTLIEQTRDCSRIYVKVENPWVSLHLVRFHIFLNVAWEKNDTDYFFFLWQPENVQNVSAFRRFADTHD